MSSPRWDEQGFGFVLCKKSGVGGGEKERIEI